VHLHGSPEGKDTASLSSRESITKNNRDPREHQKKYKNNTIKDDGSYRKYVYISDETYLTLLLLPSSVDVYCWYCFPVESNYQVLLVVCFPSWMMTVDCRILLQQQDDDDDNNVDVVVVAS
jgi:hypothetical protein